MSSPQQHNETLPHAESSTRIDSQLRPDERPLSSTEFTNYILFQQLSQLSFPTYNTNDSLRQWLNDFEQQVQFMGINTMDLCIPQFGRFMPPVIRQFLPTMPRVLKLSWKLFTEELILHFGKPEEEEYREIANRLRKFKQKDNESIPLFSAKWLHILNMLPHNYFPESDLVTIFVRALNSTLRPTLLAYIDLSDLSTLQPVINKAIDLEKHSNFRTSNTTYTTSTQEIDDPMDIDTNVNYVRGRNTQTRNYSHKQRPNNNNNYSQPRRYHNNQQYRGYNNKKSTFT